MICSRSSMYMPPNFPIGLTLPRWIRRLIAGCEIPRISAKAAIDAIAGVSNKCFGVHVRDI